eukprot:CAMPEP_0116865606 /NCGR_PEP_ID=MMETSP0418-20121206/25543_1 /TAXON_ID=1158023 /ORGANISM="Astrosyne radiata, Strain 13vi08-1A" /LENGTH=345 /DNA_ID=CAMNT_0004501101 /DNA_START=157 /DNA_END=1191 /DNA_ORIENTATION=+
MSKCAVRPWDCKGYSGRQSNTSEFATAGVSPPTTVRVDGIPYRSDRFYLLWCAAESGDEEPRRGKCECGARQSPPLLDRSRLVESLQLRAAVLVTYTFGPKWTQREFPSLFGEGARVPTLVLHGHKGLSQDQSDEASNDGRKRMTAQTSVLIHSEDEEEDTNVKNVSVKMEDEEPPEEGWRTKRGEYEEDEGDVTLPSSVHITRVLPTWLPPSFSRPTFPSNHVNLVDEEAPHEGVHPDIVKHRLKKRGVHHAKFMILLEKSGSVVIVVSTANLTKPISIEGAWLQRFEPATTRSTRSDFGHVLADLLQAQSDAARSGDMMVQEFLQRFAGIQSLNDFSKRFRFQ